MTGFSWPEEGTFESGRLRAAWPATVRALPIGARVTGVVIARQRFGVFIRIEGVPDALGLAEITSMPRDAVLPDVGVTMTGRVLGYAEHNHQVRLRLLAGPAAASQGLGVAVTADEPGTAGLTHTDHVFIDFANRAYQWVDVQRFRLSEVVGDDGAILAALIEHERFGNDYATRPGDDPELHGPYRRDQITPACYDTIDVDAAERHLRFWATRFAPVPEHIRPELERAVYQPMHAADRVYQLRDLGSAAFHDWGGVHNEFHEFVLIDHANHTLTLVVAADD